MFICVHTYLHGVCLTQVPAILQLVLSSGTNIHTSMAVCMLRVRKVECVLWRMKVENGYTNCIGYRAQMSRPGPVIGVMVRRRLRQ